MIEPSRVVGSALRTILAGSSKIGPRCGPYFTAFDHSLYAEKLLPHPQELVALGFLKTNPLAITSSRKSISVPLR